MFRDGDQLGIETRSNMGNIVPMNTIYVPIAQGRSNLCDLLNKVESGARVVFTSHGKPKAVLSAFSAGDRPRRAEVPSDPADFGDLQSPVMEDWK